MTDPIPHVLIIGAGFGGLNAARALRKAPVRITLLDRKNYHLFQPLLYQVATSGLSPGDIAFPARTIFRKQHNLTFRMAEVRHIALANKRLDTSTGPLTYDNLILAAGSETSYFGLQSVQENGLGLKDIDEAVSIRNRVLRMFELAAQELDAEKRRALLTFIVVGGGPTGVESAGALSELIRLVLLKDYPNLSIKDTRILLLEAADRLLGGFPENLQEYAAETLWRKHVEVRFGAAVTGFDGERVLLKSAEVIPARTLIWAAGVRAARIVDTLGTSQPRQGRVAVTPTLNLPDHPAVFVIGDAAYFEHDGQPLPMMAPVAIQQGRTAARNILHHLRGESLEEFIYKDPGSLATIGRNAAVARLRGFKFTGFLAWFLWLGVHLLWLVGFRNKLVVLINWAWDYFFYDRGIRLITPQQKWPWTPGKDS
ncbi:MAG TPA: NAD(P)/FAD-dependent oxidoreductase [Anaerolineales bacterium]|nr:NAD(P)/FAD-dependent oxidoreductase [Anaerolineales bacterium]